MFDGKVGEVDYYEKTFEELTAPLRAALAAEAPAEPPLWRRAASAVGGFALSLLALAAAAGLLYLFAAAARLGWNFAG